jgi:hypothetical protein
VNTNIMPPLVLVVGMSNGKLDINRNLALLL